MDKQPVQLDGRRRAVLSDRTGSLTGCDKSDPPGQLLRQVIAVNDADSLKPMRLLTSLLDLHAWQISALYRKRWQSLS